MQNVSRQRKRKRTDLQTLKRYIRHAAVDPLERLDRLSDRHKRQKLKHAGSVLHFYGHLVRDRKRKQMNHDLFDVLPVDSSRPHQVRYSLCYVKSTRTMYKQGDLVQLCGFQEEEKAHMRMYLIDYFYVQNDVVMVYLNAVVQECDVPNNTWKLFFDDKKSRAVICTDEYMSGMVCKLKKIRDRVKVKKSVYCIKGQVLHTSDVSFNEKELTTMLITSYMQLKSKYIVNHPVFQKCRQFLLSAVSWHNNCKLLNLCKSGFRPLRIYLDNRQRDYDDDNDDDGNEEEFEQPYNNLSRQVNRMNGMCWCCASRVKLYYVHVESQYNMCAKCFVKLRKVYHVLRVRETKDVESSVCAFQNMFAS